MSGSLRGALVTGGAGFIGGDVRDADSAAAAVEGVEVVFQSAAVKSGTSREARWLPIMVLLGSESVAGLVRARELLGCEPSIDLYEGLRRTVEYFENPGGES